jgi:hypothetical protein
MTKIFITTTATDTPSYPWAHSNYLRLIKAAERSTNNRYELAHDPASADILLFVEPKFESQADILVAPLYKAFADKSVVLDFLDRPRPFVPGLYVGMTHAQIPGGFFEGAAYIRVADNRLLESGLKRPIEPDLLFSFVGKVANADGVRSSLLGLRHPRALVIDRSSNQSESDFDYVQTLLRSKFVLCPRGIGPSSWRLFETMRVGRVPVVISDDWVPPFGIDWHSFVVRVRESDVPQIPSILSGMESQWVERAHQAKQAWKDHMSYERMFGWIGERCAKVLDRSREAGYRATLCRQYVRSESLVSAARMVRQLFK